jgi:hypothetical protein
MLYSWLIGHYSCEQERGEGWHLFDLQFLLCKIFIIEIDSVITRYV